MLVIPAVDLIQGRCVRLFQGRYDRSTTYGRDPVSQARRFEDAGFERLHVVDLDGARAGEGLNFPMVAAVCQAVSIPVQTGGGIRSPEDVHRLLDAGAAHLILGTVALEQPREVDSWITRWGPQPFIVSLDLKQGRLRARGWLKQAAISLDTAVGRIQQWGVRQVICTDVERDGTLQQPSYDTISSLRSLLPADTLLIAAGGVSRPEQVRELVRRGAGGAVVGRALYEGDLAMEAFLDVG